MVYTKQHGWVSIYRDLYRDSPCKILWNHTITLVLGLFYISNEHTKFQLFNHANILTNQVQEVGLSLEFSKRGSWDPVLIEVSSSVWQILRSKWKKLGRGLKIYNFGGHGNSWRTPSRSIYWSSYSILLYKHPARIGV